MTPGVIDLSADLGEGELHEARLVEDDLWPLITSANVACGGHAGDRDSMAMAIRRCAELGVSLGAHPSYPDRLHFGRDHFDMTPEALRISLIEQISELRNMAADDAVEVSHVKPHGALYNEAHRDRRLAEAVVEAVRCVSPSLAIVASPGSQLLEVAEGAGSPVVQEGFADRRYRGDGSLLPRSETGALLVDFDAAADQAVALAQSGRYTTLCVHGDMEGAVPRIKAIRTALEKAGFTISAAARAAR